MEHTPKTDLAGSIAEAYVILAFLQIVADRDRTLVAQSHQALQQSRALLRQCASRDPFSGESRKA